MKTVMVMCGVLFMLGLVGLVLGHMSLPALGVIVGAVAGMIAGVPATILLIFILRRQGPRFRKLPAQETADNWRTR